MTNNIPDWLVEKMARAISYSQGWNPDAKVEISQDGWETYIDDARAALSVLPIAEMIEAPRAVLEKINNINN